MASRNHPKGRLLRLAQILRVFLEKEKVFTSSLSHTFQTTTRTIQRDLSLLKEAGFPLREVSRGCYQADKNLLKNYELFDETELALVVALKNMVGQLGESFQKAAGVLFNQLYQTTAELPVFIRIDESVRLDARLFGRVVRAVRERRQVCFGYEVYSPYEAIVEPYRIAYFEGFWYLVGKDTRDARIKRYALDKMKDLRMLKKGFKTVPADLDGALCQSVNIWFSSERNIEVVTLVERCCAQYFKRRKIFPTQEIEEERADGSLMISFRVSCFEEIESLLKVWLPHIRVLEPKEFKERLWQEMREWVAREGGEEEKGSG